jgi:hypothetical protein
MKNDKLDPEYIVTRVFNSDGVDEYVWHEVKVADAPLPWWRRLIQILIFWR